MRHRKHSIKFGRQRAHYNQTVRSLVSGLIINKSIATTKTKAKEASRFAEKLVTIGKKNCVANQRRAFSYLRNRDLVFILFNDIAPLFKDRNGGYTRVMLSSRRRGDNAQMAILEFVEKPKEEPTTKEEEKKKKSVSPPKSIQTQKEPIKTPDRPEKSEVLEETKQKPGMLKRIFGTKKEK